MSFYQLLLWATAQVVVNGEEFFFSDSSGPWWTNVDWWRRLCTQQKNTRNPFATDGDIDIYIHIYIYYIYTTYDIILQYSHVLGNEGRKIRYVERLDLTGMLRRVRNVTLPLMAVSDLHPQRLPSSN